MRGLCHRYLVNDCATAFNDESIDSHSSAYDALSRPTARTDGGTGCQPVQSSFTYNDRSEIIAASIGTNHFLHAYDTIGNQTNHVANAATNTFTHNALNQMVGRGVPTAPQAFAISHDLDGNLTSDGFFSYSYDAANRLASVSSNGVVLVANEYDYRGRRMKKTTPTTETTFVYDGWDLVYEREAVGDVTNETFYCWGNDLSGTLQGAGGVGGLLYLKRNGAIYVPHADANGNIVRYTDTAGNVVAEYTYDAFGKTIAQSGSMADIFRIRFSSKYYDSETGLYYYGYRFYSPVLMRWLNRDPIEEEGGLNLYGFCGNAAVGNIDLYGLVRLTVTTVHDNIMKQVKKVNDIFVLEMSSETLNGLFSSAISVDPCEITLTLQILLNKNLVDSGRQDVTYYYDPHDIYCERGSSSTSDGSPQIRAAILAHERGHASSFLNSFLPSFKRAISRFGNKRLSKAEQEEVRRIYYDYLEDFQPVSAARANQAHVDWYKKQWLSY